MDNIFTKFSLFVLLLCSMCVPAFSQAILPFASSWKYLDNGSNQNTAWRATSFDDSGWASGTAPLGYGQSSNTTNNLSYGGNTNAKYITTYFRKTITVSNPNNVDAFQGSLKVDDGAVVYVNGVEVYRVNMPTGTISYTTLASSLGTSSDVLTFVIPSARFTNGTNTIAVEVHQQAASSSDIAFDLKLEPKPSTDLSPFAFGASWKYKDDGSDQGTAWRATAFDDSAWASGSSPLGYGASGVNTTVGYGGNTNAKYPTTYFRKTITLQNPSQFYGFRCRLKKDDGIVVYLNGNEVYRKDVSNGQTYTSYASALGDPATTFDFTIPASSFVAGTNVFAVEIHQYNGSSSDIFFDMQLDGIATVQVTRGPFLQMGSQSGITVCWSTNTPVIGKVSYGTASGSLTSAVSGTTSSIDHEVRVTGLNADSKYFYGIGYDNVSLKSGADYYMRTAAPANTTRKVRVTAYGDCGLANATQANVVDAYLGYMGSNPTDVMLLLGDNAYNAGLEDEYQSTFFNSYQDKLLRNTLLFPALGNHDYANSGTRKDDHDIHYLKAFALPKNAECGGLASGKEEYYSFDYGDIHFVCLDSYGEEGDKRFWVDGAPQKNWLIQDLAANQRKWTVAYFHHPPYTMGDHNSDTESELVSIRQDLISILENAGVDLVLTGHSHTYERSKLIKNHYGAELTYDPNTNEVSHSNGRYDGVPANTPYIVPATKGQNGTVYVVAGNSGGRGNSKEAAFPHNALEVYSDNTTHGTVVLEVEGSRMDVKYLIDNGTVQDQFTLMKDPVKTTDITIEQGQTATLTPAFVADAYKWSNGQTTKTIQVSPSVGDYTYTVSDDVNGTAYVTDTYHVKVVATGSLPVELLNFNAKPLKGTNELSWSTASELNVEKFNVSRSGEDKNFKTLEEVNAKGTAKGTTYYNITDKNPLLGINYYRLTEHDKDGKSKELAVRSVNNALQATEMSVISAADGAVRINVSSLIANKAKLAITDMLGRVVASLELNVAAGANEFRIPVNQAPGIYIAKLSLAGKVLVQKFKYPSK